MKKLTIWDMDGTLTDTMYIWANLSSELLKSQGITPPDDLNSKIGIIGIRQAVDFLRETFGMQGSSEEIFAKLCELLCRYYREYATVKPGVTAILEKLKKNQIPCVLLSATVSSGLHIALESTGLAKYFGNNVFSCEDLGLHKSQVGTFEMVMAKYGVSAAETVVFEDALYAVRTAKKAGCTVCAIHDRFEKRQSEVQSFADHYFESWEDFDFAKIFDK